ncbi:MAG: hypothetical protein LUE87_12480, partial [Lachnospiraceae bacterium]|nr:hypothetical protein [Lachnospiraceae bacterium]
MCNPQNHELENRRRQRQQLTGLVDQTDVVSEYYVQPQMTQEQDTRSEHMRNYKIGSVRDAVRNVLGRNPYEALDALRSEERADMRRTRLHHSRGTRLAMGANEVLEFDIAGSGFKQFRSEHYGVKGKSNIEDYLQNAKKVKWYNRLFGFIPGIKSAREIREFNKAELRRVENELREKRERAGGGPVVYTRDEDLVRRYGEAQQISGRRRKHIRKAVSPEKQDKTRITMAGPLEMSGARNSGDYSIENLREYIKQMGVDYIQQTTGNQNWLDHPHDIWIRLRGHSRGGVATIEGAMMIKKWVHDNMPDFEQHIRFDVTQFDPVPGFGSATGENERVDMTDQNVIREGTAEMMPLGNAAETTVVYSMHTDHPLWFTPQEVAHTKRIILTPNKHSVGLDVTDRQQSSQEKDAHRAAFTAAATGAAYRLSSLNEMPEGVYVLD